MRADDAFSKHVDRFEARDAVTDIESRVGSIHARVHEGSFTLVDQVSFERAFLRIYV
jgi:hypothetical protein